MGKGIDTARGDAPIHAAVLDDFKDQLLIVLFNRLGGKVSIPVDEVDATGQYVVEMSVVERVFHFKVRAKS